MNLFGIFTPQIWLEASYSTVYFWYSNENDFQGISTVARSLVYSIHA
jgi:hypothetical protein